MQRWIELRSGVRATGDGFAWLPDERALVVADVHLGYDLAARRRGGYLPAVMPGEEAGAHIASIARDYGADHVVIAGDLRHSTRDVDDVERAEVAAFAHAVERQCRLTVLRGNHDAGAALVGRGEHHVRIGEVDIVHLPPSRAPARLTICGHLHPRVTVRDETGAAARYPSVLACEHTVILPAFSEWAGGAESAKLVRSLPAGAWRALPIHGGLIADLGITFAPREA